MQAFLERVDTLLIGRKSYELLLQHDQHPYPGKAKYVFSTTQHYPHPDVKVIREWAVEEVQAIKQQPTGKDIWLFGGSQLSATLMQAGLIDELWLSVHPILLGAGKPLFTHIQRTALTLLQTQTYDNGLVQLHYKVVR